MRQDRAAFCCLFPMGTRSDTKLEGGMSYYLGGVAFCVTFLPNFSLAFFFLHAFLRLGQ